MHIPIDFWELVDTSPLVTFYFFLLIILAYLHLTPVLVDLLNGDLIIPVLVTLLFLEPRLVVRALLDSYDLVLYWSQVLDIIPPCKPQMYRTSRIIRV